MHGVEVGLKILVVVISMASEEGRRARIILLMVLEALIAGDGFLAADTMESELRIWIG